MERISAAEAKKMMANSTKHQNDVLEKIFKEIMASCDQGMSSLPVQLDYKETKELCENVQDELIGLGYKIEGKGTHRFTLTW